MTHFLHNDADLEFGMTALIAADPRLKAIFETAGMPSLRRREAGFAGLCAIVVSQQLSTSSAAAIWSRMAAAFDPFHHDRVRLSRAPKLARIGLSKPKIKTMKAVGHAVAKGAIDLEAVGKMDADVAHAALTALHGIGPWTADIYLLFCLGHSDAWPAGDLALQEAVRMGFGLKKRPDTKAMIAFAEKWRPWRGVAAHLLWKYYGVVKKRDAVPVQTAAKSPRKKKERAHAGIPKSSKPGRAKSKQRESRRAKA